MPALRQYALLGEAANELRRRTMSVLRVAFLSGGQTADVAQTISALTAVAPEADVMGVNDRSQLARAEAQVLVPMEYSGFLWAVLFGWLFFAEQVSPFTIAGSSTIA